MSDAWDSDLSVDLRHAVAEAVAAASIATVAAQAAANSASAAAAAAQAVADAALPASVTVSAPTRSLDSAFQPDPDHGVLGIWTVSLSVTAGLLSTSSAEVDLLSDAADPPTTLIESISVLAEGLAGLSLSFKNTDITPMIHYVPAGDWVLLSSSHSGTATLSVVASTEIAFTG